MYEYIYFTLSAAQTSDCYCFFAAKSIMDASANPSALGKSEGSILTDPTD